MFCKYVPDVIIQTIFFICSLEGTAASAIWWTPIESFVSLQNETKQGLSWVYTPHQMQNINSISKKYQGEKIKLRELRGLKSESKWKQVLVGKVSFNKERLIQVWFHVNWPVLSGIGELDENPRHTAPQTKY